MNASDWVQMTGHPVVGRGARPINPKMLIRSAKTRPAKSSAALREARQLSVQVARTIREADALLPRATARQYARAATPRDPSLMEQSAPGAAGAAARLQHAAAVQRARKRF